MTDILRIESKTEYYKMPDMQNFINQNSLSSVLASNL